MFTFPNIIYTAVSALCVLVSLCIFPPYVGVAFPKKSMKSLHMKMVLSACFTIIAVMSALLSKNTSLYAVFMLIGFGFSWVGDYILGKGEGTKRFLCGAAAFFVAHLLFITAMSIAMKKLYPDVPFVDKVTVTVYAVVLVLEAILCITRKAQFHGIFLPMLIYSCALLLTFSRTCALGWYMLADGVCAAVILPIGGFFFLIADTTLAMMRFRMHKKNFAFRSFSSITYFVGQIFLAFSLLIVK